MTIVIMKEFAERTITDGNAKLLKMAGQGDCLMKILWSMARRRTHDLLSDEIRQKDALDEQWSWPECSWHQCDGPVMAVCLVMELRRKMCMIRCTWMMASSKIYNGK